MAVIFRPCCVVWEALAVCAISTMNFHSTPSINVYFRALKISKFSKIYAAKNWQVYMHYIKDNASAQLGHQWL